MWQTLARLFWASSLTILMLGSATSSSGLTNVSAPAPSVAGISSPTSSLLQFDKQRGLFASNWPAASPDFSKFTGVWTAHGALLSFATNGKAAFNQRTYSWCGPSVAQPCDSIGPRGSIQPGDNEQIQFSHADGPIAYGTVVSSNFHPRGLAVTLEIKPGNTLLYASHTAIALLCGPSAPVGTCGA